MQCEIGALVVGGIFNEKENSRFSKGMEKGHFELAGSTIILLFEKEQIQTFSGRENTGEVWRMDWYIGKEQIV